MSQIKRFNAIDVHFMYEDANGPYITWEDHAAENAQLQLALETAKAALKECEFTLAYVAYNIDGSKIDDLPQGITESTGVAESALIAQREALNALAAIRLQGAGQPQHLPVQAGNVPAIMLTRDTSGRCEVSLQVDGQWLVVIRDSGDIISHVVNPSGIKSAIAAQVHQPEAVMDESNGYRLTYDALESLYFAQCGLTDELAEKLAEGSDKTLQARIAELEADLAAMNRKYMALNAATPCPPSSAPIEEREEIPLDAIGSILNQVMEQAVKNGANSISMPDEYVAVAHFIAYPQKYAALSAPAIPKWISVEERLPGEQGQDSEDVLVFLNGHCASTDMECRKGGAWGLRIGFYDAEKGRFRAGGLTSDVTHWMPLPAGPAAQIPASPKTKNHLDHEAVDLAGSTIAPSSCGSVPIPASTMADDEIRGNVREALIAGHLLKEPPAP